MSGTVVGCYTFSVPALRELKAKNMKVDETAITFAGQRGKTLLTVQWLCL